VYFQFFIKKGAQATFLTWILDIRCLRFSCECWGLDIQAKLKEFKFLILETFVKNQIFHCVLVPQQITNFYILY
jgi:hypothetical protein